MKKMIAKRIKQLMENDKIGFPILMQQDSELSKNRYIITFFDQEIMVKGSTTSDLLHAVMYLKRNVEALEFSNKFSIERKAKQAERGLMLDIGRKFYSLSTIKRIVDSMCLLEMNVLQLHFSENEGFRIESETFPEIVSEKYLTKKEIRELIDYCSVRGIEIVPELDSPGHLKCLLQMHPEFVLQQAPEIDPILAFRAIDITNIKAVQAVKTLLDEYLALFKDSKIFHVGVDEFIDFNQLDYYPELQKNAKAKYGPDATGYELYIDYINEIVAYVSEQKRRVRIWNDGLFLEQVSSVTPLTKEVEITYWTKHQENMASVDKFLEQGYRVVNFNDNYFYFVLGEAADYRYPTASKIEKEWECNIFPRNQTLNDDQMGQVIGTYFAIWSDRPTAMSEFEVYHTIFSPLKAQQEKLWITDKVVLE